MNYLFLPHTSIKVSRLALGTLHFGVYLDLHTARSLVDMALSCGINFIETAPIYGNECSEQILGETLRGRRHDVVLSTKVGLKAATDSLGRFSVKIEKLTAQTIKRSVENSLTALVTDYIDLLQMHAFDPETPLLDSIETLDTLVREGKIRAWGVSNFDEQQSKLLLQAIRTSGFIEPSTFQVHYNLLERRAEKEIFPLTSNAGLCVIVNRGLARGLLSGKYRINQSPPPGSRALDSMRIRALLTEDRLRVVGSLGEYAGRFGKTASQLAVAWLVARSPNIIPMLGIRDSDQLSENVAALDWKLSHDNIRQIDEIFVQDNMMEKANCLPATFFER